MGKRKNELQDISISCISAYTGSSVGKLFGISKDIPEGKYLLKDEEGEIRVFSSVEKLKKYWEKGHMWPSYQKHSFTVKIIHKD